jgi:hypothetical protein
VKSLDVPEAGPFKFGDSSPERKSNEPDCNFTWCKTGTRPRSAPARREEVSSKFSLLPEQTGAMGSGHFMKLEAREGGAADFWSRPGKGLRSAS